MKVSNAIVWIAWFALISSAHAQGPNPQGRYIPPTSSFISDPAETPVRLTFGTLPLAQIQQQLDAARAADANSRRSWFSIDLGSVVSLGRVSLKQTPGAALYWVELESSADGSTFTAISGTTRLGGIDPQESSAFTPLAAVPGAPAANAPIRLDLDLEHPGAAIGPGFSGLSYEAAALLPGNGPRYFRADNHALITLFHTLGIKSLRIGGNTSDRNASRLPEFADLDSLFGFAKAAGVRVIFCLRLHDGDPALDAATAKYILDHYAPLVDSLSIGQEPSAYPVQEVDTRPPSERMGGSVEKFPYGRYRGDWQRFDQEIVSAAPAIQLAGPSVHNNPDWTRHFIDDFGRDHHIALITEHLYPGGAAGKLPSARVGRDRMLSGEFFEVYQKLYDGFVPTARAAGLPYRLEEVNSYFNGGAQGASDTFTAALWGLEFMYWWATHEAAGLNFHTGDRVSMNDDYQAPRYATFVTASDGFDIRPLAYAFKIFDLGAHGRIIPVALENTASANVSAFATLADENNVSVTIINKEHEDGARDTSVRISIGNWTHAEMISLEAPHADVVATTGIELGGVSIKEDGTWNGAWRPLPAPNRRGELQVNVRAASAAVVRFSKRHPHVL